MDQVTGQAAQAAVELPVRENVTEGALRIIETIIKRENSHDRRFLLEKVCEELEAKYVGESLEYHLSQMNINTTTDILHAIDIFFVMEKMFPDTTFLRGDAAEAV